MNALIPTVHAVMARRILVNFRVKPEVAARLLPQPFRPKLVKDHAMAGICLIRLEEMRPVWLPRWFGVASENAAHRIAVEWDMNGRSHEGVFIPRRDTNSLLNHVAGGRLFPGVHHRAEFRCSENRGRFNVQLRSYDGAARVKVVARVADGWPSGSVFNSLEETSKFFRGGFSGWSPSTNCGLEGVELRPEKWEMHPLTLEHVESSFFNDPRRFPPASVEFDSALLMHGIGHEWRTLGHFGESPGCAVQHHRGARALVEMP